MRLGLTTSGFGRLESYPYKVDGRANEGRRSASEILSEAARHEGFCHHMSEDEIKPPIHYQGKVAIEDMFDLLQKQIEKKCIPYSRNGKEYFRKQKQTEGILLTAVFSWPEPISKPISSLKKLSPTVKAYFDECIDFFIKRHGYPQNIVLHVDEKMPHVHVHKIVNQSYLSHPGLRASRGLNPFGANSDRSKLKELDTDEQRKQEYRSAMQSWQDDLFDSVFFKFGFDRYSALLRRRFPRKYFKKVVSPLLAKHKKLSDELVPLIHQRERRPRPYLEPSSGMNAAPRIFRGDRIEAFLLGEGGEQRTNRPKMQSLFEERVKEFLCHVDQVMRSKEGADLAVLEASQSQEQDIANGLLEKSKPDSVQSESVLNSV